MLFVYERIFPYVITVRQRSSGKITFSVVRVCLFSGDLPMWPLPRPVQTCSLCSPQPCPLTIQGPCSFTFPDVFKLVHLDLIVEGPEHVQTYPVASYHGPTLGLAGKWVVDPKDSPGNTWKFGHIREFWQTFYNGPPSGISFLVWQFSGRKRFLYQQPDAI